MNPRWGQFFMTQRGQFRMAFDSLLALASLNRACRNLCPGFSATFTTIALNDSSLRGLEAST